MHHNHKKEMSSPYKFLAIMIFIHFVLMYILMYSMTNTFSNVFNNLNQFYMAGLMTSVMIILELIFMKSMYPNKKVNLIIIIAGILILIIFFIFIRQQTAISDEQFLKSMIPHHASAILMCEQTKISDPEIKTLCNNIITSQQAEIDQMKEMLNRLQS
jgi:peptidoglycan biosynthesis protein MviN/MurJ (putative lipid II flippase)